MTEREQNEARGELLGEILGFDSKSGERVEERSGLRQVKPETLVIPEEIQDAFARHIAKNNKSNRRVFKVVPEKLFAIFMVPNFEDGEMLRSYHFWDRSCDASEQEFPVQAVAGFGATRSILINNEHSADFGSDSIRLRFSADETRFNFWLSRRGFTVGFNNENSICDIWFVPEYRIEYKSKVEKLEIGEIIEKGHFKLDTYSGYYLFLAEQENIRLKSFNSGILEDEILMPQHIDRELMIQKLFDAQTLRNPANVLTELDDSWRRADLMGVVGVKWEIH